LGGVGKERKRQQLCIPKLFIKIKHDGHRFLSVGESCAGQCHASER